MDITLRIALALTGTLAYDLLAPRIFDDGDGIGEGILYFLLVVAFAAAWAAFDGYVCKPVVRTAMIWVAVTVAITIYFPVRDAVQDARRGDHSVTMLSRFELIDLVFFLAIVLVPAAGAYGLGRLVAPRPASAK